MKSFEYIVDGGDNGEIAQTIFNNKPAGTRAFGSKEELINDSEGIVHSICYTPAKPINIGINIKIEASTSQSQTWKNEIAKALKDKFDDIQSIGTPVKGYNYYTVLTMFNEISDILEIQFYNVEETTDIKYYTTYDIGIREIAKLDVKNINITIG